MSYNVEKTFGSLICSKLVEPEVNHVASEYFTEHYNEIKRQASKMVGVDPSKVEDLVNDVYESILRGENEGNGYDIDHSHEGSIITVADFVYGRLKLYSKNRRYAAEGCDRHVSTKRVNNQVVTTVDFDVAYASPDNSRDLDEMTGIQRAYANASCIDDDIELINDTVSLRQDIEFCLDFSSVVGMNFLNLFKNIDMFTANMDSSIFDNLREQLKYHDELSDALYSVLSSAANHRAVFDAVVETF